MFLLSSTAENLVLLQYTFHLHATDITISIIIRVHTFEMHLCHHLDSSQVLNGLIHFPPLKECIEITNSGLSKNLYLIILLPK